MQLTANTYSGPPYHHADHGKEMLLDSRSAYTNYGKVGHLLQGCKAPILCSGPSGLNQLELL